MHINFSGGMESSSAIEAVPREGSIGEKDSSFFQLAVEKKKRKRGAAGKIGRPAKAESEAQRMTHIVVERNRRRLMNEHLAQLRSLMPSSFIQRGDQASIIGGAIDFIKEMEQMAVYLQTEKSSRGWPAVEEEEVDVEATAVQGHVNLKVEGRRIPGQVVRAISAMEDLRLTVLHLTITSLDALSVLYSLNLKMEEDCKLRSAEEIASAVHQLFSYADTT